MSECAPALCYKEDFSKFVLRFTVGFLMLFHGIAKLSSGVGFIEGLFTSSGLPGFLAYGVYLGEIVAPIMLIVGFKVRIAALLVAATMIVAILTVHLGDIFAVTEHGAWGIELQMFYILTCVAIFLQGAGKYSFDERHKQ